MSWRKITLIGVGLLGGSLGLALRRRGFAKEVHGYVRDESRIAPCLDAGAVDIATADLAAAVKDADLIVFCTPLSQMEGLAVLAAPSVRKGALITDVGSAKSVLVKQLEPIFSKVGAVFVGSHPMAGSDKTGVGAARENLFQNAACVVTPTAAVPPEKSGETEALWRAVGGRVMRMTPELHDELVSRSSHLPHVIAATLASYVLGGDRAQADLCATGFKDSTRIASGSPEMWRDIALMNSRNLGKALNEFGEGLKEFQRLLEKNDPAAIEKFFEGARRLRDDWKTKCAAQSPE